MTDAKAELLRALGECIAQIAPEAAITPVFESPKQAAHGDLAITAAMPLARALKKPPREIAQSLVDRLEAREAVKRWVERIEIAGPGFVNLHLRDAARQAIVAEVLAAGERFGTKPPTGDKVLVEFVSANPTGPLHVGHGRNAALGDAIANLLATQGASVTREFYYNDAGVQIATLAESVHARLIGLKPGDAGWPESAYNGDYIADIAADFAAGKTVAADDRRFAASGDADDREGIREFAVASLRHEQDLDLRAFGVRFDVYSLESSLYRESRVEDVVRTLRERGKTFEEGGALWLRTTEYGDDKDRVMRKSDGTYTYFVPDVAYHLDKWRRGFSKAIDVLGTDHHGSLARVRAGVQAAGADEGIPPGYPDYVLYKMITVMRGGEEVKISKRAGGYVTLRDLVEWTSRDAVRFFLSSRKADTEFVFDVDLALKKNDENPVFYVQYAHARICSVLALWVRDRGGDPAMLAGADLSRLAAPAEIALMRLLADYSGMLEAAARSLAPHDVAFYLRGLAAALHGYYAAERFLVDDAGLARARMALLAACAQVLRNALVLLGVGAPEAMNREPEASGGTNGETAAGTAGDTFAAKAPA